MYWVGILLLSAMATTAFGDQNCTAQTGNVTLSLAFAPTATLVLPENNVSYLFSLCTPSTFCAKSVFVASELNSTDCASNAYFDGVEALVATGSNTISRTFNSTSSNSTITVSVRCNSSAADTLDFDPTSVSTSAHVYLTSASVCPGYAPPDDDGPGDSTVGFIIGGVIFAIGVVLVFGVILKWRALSKKENALGEYTPI